MLLNRAEQLQDFESFDPGQCTMKRAKLVAFPKNNIVSDCSDGCWSGCIGTCRRFQH